METKDRPVYVDTLWVRHCNSCSNVDNAATDPEEKYLIPPVCTPQGMRQSLRLALGISSFARSMGVPVPSGVRFYCSYLPRAMLTACLAASALHALWGEGKRIKVQALCHVGELPNPFEREAQGALGADKRGCVRVSSESISTEGDSGCWRRKINQMMRDAGFAARVRAPMQDCAPRTGDCSPGWKKAWMFGDGDFDWVLQNLVPGWLEKGDQELQVVVSHGTYIKELAAHNSPQLVQVDVQNTGVIVQRYEGVSTAEGAQQRVRFLRATTPDTQGAGKRLPETTSSPEAEALLETLSSQADAQFGPDPCDWKGDGSFRECLKGPKEATLAALHARAQSAHSRGLDQSLIPSSTSP